MLELYQAEWCPYSHAVRQRLTELGLEWRSKPVEAEPADRAAMREATGHDVIPVLVADGGAVVAGTEEILEHLDRTVDEPPEARRHRAQARAHGVYPQLPRET